MHRRHRSYFPSCIASVSGHLIPFSIVVLILIGVAAHALGSEPSGRFRGAARENQVIVSDDFHATKLDTTVWRFDDAVGDVTLWMTGTNAVVSIPGGTNHDLRATGMRATRLMQAAANDDFEVEGKFDSEGSSFYQGHGIMVAEDIDTYLRFEIIFGEAPPRIYAAYENAGAREPKLDQYLGALPPYLRVTRTGNQWSFLYSYDGTSWTNAVSFAQLLTVGEVGVYFYAAPNSADEMWWTPAFVGNVDYFFNRASPISPEDGGQPTAPTPPVIELWGGNEQDFGHLGVPQQWFNVLGRVWDTEAVDSLFYRLNGGPSFPLSMGPDITRLIGVGDYNIEIDYEDLLAGPNEVIITAVDALGERRDTTLTVNYTAGVTWPLPDTVEFEAASEISDVAHVADGRWRLVAGQGVRVDSTTVGYDRLLVLGDRSWKTNYEVLLPLTIHAASATWLTGVGLGVGWPGHTGTDQPRLGHPYQALVWITGFATNPALVIDRPGVVEAITYRAVEADVRYLMRVRSQSLEDGMSRVRAKLWEDGAPEPIDWELSADVPTRDGGVFLVAHRSEVTFGDVEIVPVPPLVTAVTDPVDGPGALTIRRFYPNPFRGHTLVEYGIPEKADVEIAVYDAAGRLVCAERLPDVPGGWHTYVFRGVDSNGNLVPSGVYFCRFNSPGGAATKKVVILR